MTKGCAPLALAGLVGAAAGCGPEVPEEPAWAEDVRPILLANCASCHSFPPIRGAPGPGDNRDGFRLDVYGNSILDEGTEYLGVDLSGRTIPGAAAMSDRIVARAVEAETMPPSLAGGPRPLTSRQQEILRRWHEQGAERGPPAPGNQPPDMELVDASQDGDVLVIEYRIRDADFDYVTGTLRAIPDGGGDASVITRALHSGRGLIHWGVGDRAGETVELVATLDDGSVTGEAVSLGPIQIE